MCVGEALAAQRRRSREVLRGVVGVSLLSVTLVGVAAPAAATSDPCDGWTPRTIASGLGVLENVEPDGRGGLLLSTERDTVERIAPDGTVTVLAEGLDRPGGLRVRDGRLFVTTGNGLLSGVLGTDDGTLTRIDLDTGERVVVATGLVMPNGLVFDHAGDAYVSRDLGLGGAITRIPGADPPGSPGPPSQPAGTPHRWAELGDTNGLAVSADGRHLYTVETFTLPSNVYRVDLADPSSIETVGSLYLTGGSPVPKGLDDLDIDADDVLYITANAAGEVLRFDPVTGDACIIATGLTLPSAATFGLGPGWPTDHLYVVGFGGDVVELAPPPGLTTGRAPAPPGGAAEGQPAPGPEGREASLQPRRDGRAGDPPTAERSAGGTLPVTGGTSPLLGLVLLGLAVGSAWRRPSASEASAGRGFRP